MNIWVDADACPVAIKDILFRAAKRTGISLTLIANRALPIPPSPVIHFIQVASGFDVADNEIVRRAGKHDIVITADIPLAAEVVGNGAVALSPRGELFTANDIKARLSVRNFVETLRASGVNTGGPAAPGQREKQNFANQLDRLLSAQHPPATG